MYIERGTTWEQIQANAPHYLALKQTLYVECDIFPFEDATGLESGGSCRLDFNTSIRFNATDPKTGLELSTNFDLENRDANGKGVFDVDLDSCRRVMLRLPEPVKKQFSEYLQRAADKVAQKGEEYRSAMNGQMNIAAMLRKAAEV